MSDLVDFLSRGEHPVELSRYQRADELKECLERSYVLVRFTDTRGGTELGVRLDLPRCETGHADFVGATGMVRLVGHLNLDFVDIECIVDVDLTSLSGTGCIQVVPAAAVA